MGAVFGFFCGADSVIKYRERSVTAIIATIIGLLILFFLVGEFTMPH
ncbi:MAG: hypothetical protein ABH846_04935 [Patescibacteria group bacterium]